MGQHSDELRSDQFGLQGNWVRELIEWAGGGAHLAGGNAQIAGGSSQAAMSQEQLNGADVGARLQQMNGEGVAQAMGSDRLGNVTAAVRPLTCFLHGCRGDMSVDATAWK